MCICCWGFPDLQVKNTRLYEAKRKNRIEKRDEGQRNWERARPSDRTLKKVLQREATFFPSCLAWESGGPGFWSRFSLLNDLEQVLRINTGFLNV